MVEMIYRCLSRRNKALHFTVRQHVLCTLYLSTALLHKKNVGIEVRIHKKEYKDRSNVYLLKLTGGS